MYNPDYPTDQGAGFLQHTYQNTPRNDMYFWGGFSGNPSGCYNDGSRRNMMNPVNPAAPNPFAQFGQTQSTVPEQAVQPFSSYPPSPMAQPGGLNAAIESRRNIPNQMPNQNNPWAKPQAPAMNGFNPTTPAPQQPPMYFDQNPYGNYYYGPDTNTLALYNNNSFGFDKRNSWDNYYTQNRPYPMPTINWREQQQQQQNCYGPNQFCMNQYQIQPFPTAPMNWKDKAMENWSYQR